MRLARESTALGLFTFALISALAFPADLWAFMDEDTLKISGIAIGITLGVCLVVVLIAGTMKDLGDDDEDFLARLPLPEGAWESGISLLDGTAFQERPSRSTPASGRLPICLPLPPQSHSGSVRGRPGPLWTPGSSDFGLKKESVPGYADLHETAFPLPPAREPS